MHSLWRWEEEEIALSNSFKMMIQHASQFTVTVWTPLTMLLRRACDVSLQREKDFTMKCPKYINYAILVLWHVLWADLSATLHHIHHTNLWLYTVS